MRKFLGAVLVLLTVAVVAVGLWKYDVLGMKDDSVPSENPQQLAGTVISPEDGANQSPDVPAEQPAEPEAPAEPEFPAENFDTTAWELLLVNPWNAIPDDYEMHLTNLNLSNSMQAASSMQADARVYDALVEMLNACKNAGLNPVVCSAYRPYDTQVYLFNNKINRLKNQGYDAETARQEAARVVAVPGTSEHQTGMAFDIVALSYQLLEEDQENTAEQKWLMEHCYEYGFILRYPKEKEAITGIIYEPWHYRYVGKEAAISIRDSGMCLEEWLGKAEEASLPRLPYNG